MQVPFPPPHPTHPRGSASQPKRILVVRLSHLGDVVHALPLFHALREAFPSARMAWAVERSFAPLVEGLPGLERALVLDRRGGARAWLRFAEDMLSFAPDLAVDAQGNLKSALATLCSRAARRAGMHARDWQEPLGSITLTERAPRAGDGARDPPQVHALERMLALARHVTGRRIEAGELRLDPDLSEDERAHGRECAARWFDPRPGPRAVLQLSGAGDVRSWPLERWQALAVQLARSGRQVLALSGPGEEGEGHELARRLAREGGEAARVRHWVGQRGLRELAAFYSAAAEQGARLVGCDSGPLHLATACGLRAVLLAGPQSHLRTGPWPIAREFGALENGGGLSRHWCVRSGQPPECAPCLRRTCSHPAGPTCMRDLEPARVAEALSATV